MKKLLKVLRSKWFIAVVVVLLTVIFALAAVKGTARTQERVVAYNWYSYNSFRDGLPDYGLRRRNNILPQR